MPTVETKIWLAIKRRIASITPQMLGLSHVDFSSEPSLVLNFVGDQYEQAGADMYIAWPAQAFEPPYFDDSLQPYIRVGSVTTSPVPVFIDAGRKHRRTGTLTLTLVHPLLKNTEVSLYREIAGKIAEHFAEGVNMLYNDVCVTVTAYPHVQAGYEDTGYWTIPVTIPWQTYA